MGVTRRGFIKRALTAGALALVPSLPGLPEVGGPASKSYADAVWTANPIAYWPLGAADSAPAPLFNGSHVKLDNFGVSSSSVRQRMEQLRGEMDREQAWVTAVLAQTECKDEFSVTLERGKCVNDEKYTIR